MAWHRHLFAYLDLMRFLAVVTMMFAWFVYGTMSAWAGCPLCASMAGSASVGANSDVHHDHMAGRGMPGMNMAGIDMHDAGKNAAPQPVPAKDPCSAGGMMHMSVCSACLVVPAAVTVYAGGRQVFSYPSPAPAAAFPGARPAPLAPPPRLV